MAKSAAWLNTYWVMLGIEAAHANLALPWWAAIIAVNASSKPIAFMLQAWNQYNTAKMTTMQYEVANLKKMQVLAQQAPTAQQRQTMLAKINDLYTAHQAKYGAGTGLVVRMGLSIGGSAFMFFSIFNGVRNLMMSKAWTLTTGGALWFTDLTVPDPYYGLPIICSAVTMAMIHFNMNLDGAPSTTPVFGPFQPKHIKWVLMGASWAFVPMGSMVPAGVALMWATNTGFSVLQGAALRTPRVRQLFGLPAQDEMQRMAAVSREVSQLNTATAVVTVEQQAVAQAASAAKDAQGKPLLFTGPPLASRGIAGKRQAIRQGA